MGGIGDDSVVFCFRAKLDLIPHAQWSRRRVVVASSSRRFSFGAIGVEMGKWPPVGVSSPLASRGSRAFREHVCGACDAPWGV